MYARSTTLQAQPGAIDAGIMYFRDEAIPQLQAIDGYVGASLVVNRETGRCIVAVTWSTAETRQASAESVMPIRERASAVFGAGEYEIDEWEIVAMHRDHPAPAGACVRMTWGRFDPARADEFVDMWKRVVLPAASALDGFCSISLVLDRANGRSIGTATFESRAALEQSRDASAEIRARAGKEGPVEIADVQEFELAHAHLHVPEMV